jgi:hypothetical protein
MTTHDDKQAPPGQNKGKESDPAGAPRPAPANDDDDVTRMNIMPDVRSADSGSGKREGAADDRLRDGT